MIRPKMMPAPDEHLARFVGDRLRMVLEVPREHDPALRGVLRTNLTRARVSRAEVAVQAGLRTEDALTFAGASWRDIPMAPCEQGFCIDLPLLEVGHFRAKAYVLDSECRQYWPVGGDLGISVHPDRLRTSNIVYCAFPRAIGREPASLDPEIASAITALDHRGFSVIPPSGTLRGLRRALPHIFDALGCRILQLMPVGPVPTTWARMGRYGSPYAQLSLTGIDPALVEFDKRTTAEDQFRELADAVHVRDGLLTLDVVLNHTGWGSELMNQRARWFKRHDDGCFQSPGAWGTIWADLVELDQSHPELWEVLANALITWCERGVDGFRCDAGYMIPLAAWQYIVARVRQRFPDCIFLLEGLGGAWDATAGLLSVGGMQCAYSELFQCFEPRHVAEYLDHANAQSPRLGPLLHFSETHDNDRLAKRGLVWSRMRNQLSALSSHAGAFGFTAGVEWLCTEKIDVHEARSLGFGNQPNLMLELGRLNQLLRHHPCFFDGARIERVSELDSPVLALLRTSYDEADVCLVLVNLDCEQARTITLARSVWQRGGEKRLDLLGGDFPTLSPEAEGAVCLELPAGASHCLAARSEAAGLAGDAYRARRAQAAWALTQLGEVFPHEHLAAFDFCSLGQFASCDPAGFLAALRGVDREALQRDLLGALESASRAIGYPSVVTVRADDARRITLIPPQHWILVRDEHPFAVDFTGPDGTRTLRSTAMADDHVAAFLPGPVIKEHDASLCIERFGAPGTHVRVEVRLLTDRPVLRAVHRTGRVLLTNGRGGMARIGCDLAQVTSKYDCLLAANLATDVPEDRHVFVKRMRAWVVADGFVTALDGDNLLDLRPESPAIWTFAANAGDGCRVVLKLSIRFVSGRNTLVIQCERVASDLPELPTGRAVHLTVRLDLEDRSFHHETQLTPELLDHFERVMTTNDDGSGFVFQPESSRRLTAWTDDGTYHPQTECCYGIGHPMDASRGMASAGDAFSPGWFDLPLEYACPATLVVSAEPELHGEIVSVGSAPASGSSTPRDPFERALRFACEQFLVRRGEGKTVIAGYPWFLDWGRDTFIAARGLVAGGFHDEVRSLLRVYGRFERQGTLPNFLAGEGEGSRETSDAPLWYALACEELAGQVEDGLYAMRVDDARTLGDVLVSIASHMREGTPVGVKVDPKTGLVWSPPHYTWMDTNYPAGTPREGYPIELSVLWIRLLRQLARLGAGARDFDPATLAAQAEASLQRFFRADLGFFADTLHAPRGTSALDAVPDDHLRPNQLLAVSLGLISDVRAKRAVEAATRWLLIPGAMRTLAPLRVSYPLRVCGRDGRPLIDAEHPYRGRYEGDEDTQRKPAYHNGTGWAWWLPTYCEAMVRAYDREPAAVSAARSILGSLASALDEGCIGQLPEIVDGDVPHTQRGCDAQAWSVSEALRLWLLLR